MSETKEKKVVGRRIALALGIICIVLASCLVWAIVVLSSLNSQISSLNSQVSSLNSELVATPVTVSELANNSSMWVNKAIMVEGQLSLFLPPGFVSFPFDYELTSNGTTIGVSWSINPHYNDQNVLVVGIVTAGRSTMYYANGTWGPVGPVIYFIEAEGIYIP